jgi:hypothetical protein
LEVESVAEQQPQNRRQGFAGTGQRFAGIANAVAVLIAFYL